MLLHVLFLRRESLNTSPHCCENPTGSAFHSGSTLTWVCSLSSACTGPRQPASACGGHRFQTTASLGINHGPRCSADTSLNDRRPGVLCRRTSCLERPAIRRHLITKPRPDSTSSEDKSILPQLPQLTSDRLLVS